MGEIEVQVSEFTDPGALLTTVEQSRRAEYEETIGRTRSAFVECGRALAGMRDERLYRNTHGTFEAYCQEVWGFSRPRAYQLIEAAQVVSTVVDKAPELPAPTNEAQARELARVPEEQRAEVWQRVVTKADGKPTAAAIREVVSPPPRPEPPAPALSPFVPPPVDPPTPEEVTADIRVSLGELRGLLATKLGRDQGSKIFAALTEDMVIYPDAKSFVEFTEVGRALLEVRDGRLYRDRYATFETYCHDRWGLNPAASAQLVEIAEMVAAAA